MAASDGHGFEINDENCQKRVEEFVRLTQTDEALAQFFLQDRDWDLQRSVNDYLDSMDGQTAHKRTIDEVTLNDSDDSDCNVVFESPTKTKAIEDNSQSSSCEPSVDIDVKDLKDFRFICWNIDGIDEKNLRLRTEAVAKHIKEANALIVFLQEVIHTSEAILRQSLPDYEFLSGNNQIVKYYTLTLVHKKYVKLIDNQVIGFANSIMGRNLLKTRVSIGDVSLCLLNTHLESTKDFADSRVQQLRTAFQEMSQMDSASTVIFGGDLNLRDTEVQKLGGFPAGVYDVWIKTGARK
ncbi:unnamed protein product, partial [Oppiella nova]